MIPRGGRPYVYRHRLNLFRAGRARFTSFAQDKRPPPYEFRLSIRTQSPFLKGPMAVLGEKNWEIGLPGGLPPPRPPGLPGGPDPPDPAPPGPMGHSRRQIKRRSVNERARQSVNRRVGGSWSVNGHGLWIGPPLESYRLWGKQPRTNDWINCLTNS